MSIGLSTGIFLDTPTLGSLLASLSASTLTRTSAVTAYPPTISFTRPIDWQDGDKAVMQWSTDSTFATGVTETATPQTMVTGTTTYNFGLSAIVSGVYYMRLGAWRGTRPGALNWSNTTGVGNAAVPTISSSAAIAGSQYVAGSFAQTASMAVAWAIVGGADAAQFAISGQNLTSLAPQTASPPPLTVQVQATSLFGVASAIQTITDTVASNTATAFSFTAVASGARSTLFTSNTITVAGIVGGASNPVVVSGAQYSKNGGAYTAANTTAVNGDTFSLQETSSASYSTAVSGTLTIGVTASTYTVNTLANPAMVGFTASTTQPASISNANASAVYNFVTDFVTGGYGVVFIPWLFNGRVPSDVRIIGADTGAADIVLVSRASDASPQYIYCCPDNKPIVNGGTLTVRITLSAVYDVLGMMGGTLTNTSTTVTTGTANLVFPTANNPFSTTSAITISATGVGVAFATANGGTVTANTGALVKSGLAGWNGAVSGVGGISRQINAGAWTPGFSQASQAGAGILAAMWG